MEEDPPHECKCRCDPLKRVLHWIFQKLLENYSVQSSDDVVSSVGYLYKTSVFRNLARSGSNFDFVINQETLLLVGEWISGSIFNGGTKGSKIVGKEDIKELMVNLQSKASCDNGTRKSQPFITSMAYENPLGNIRLSLNLGGMKGSIIRYAVNRGWNKDVGNIDCHSRKYQVQIVMTCRATTDEEHNFSWTDYRKLIVAQGICKLLSLVGHQVEESHYTTIIKNGRMMENDYYNSIVIIGKDITKLENGNRTNDKDLLSKPEVVLRTELAEITAESMSLSGLLNERLTNISESIRSEASLSTYLTSAQNLAKATLHYDILKKSLDDGVHLFKFELRRESHHALFIMYNYARVLSILKRFSEQVEKSEYPPLAELANIDFTGICEKEEEIQLLQLLMEWPRILETAINFIRFEATLHVIPKFLLSLARTFNNFYFEVAVLVPPNAPHNFPMMMARVYLVKGICNIFQDCFDILQLAHSAA